MRATLVVLIALVAVPASFGADGEPKKALTTAGNAAARSVVLKRADLSPAFTMLKRADDDLPAGVRCGALDESDLTINGEAQSPDFQLTQQGVYVTVGSTVNVYRTLREAGASWRRGTSAQTTTCFADIVRLSAPRGQRVKIVSAKRLTVPKVAPMTAAFRVVATLTLTGNQRVTAYVDAIILQHGRVQSGVVFTSLGRPVGQPEQLGLAALVAGRMAKANRPKGPTA
ncbi:MAG TPA: hypothetical protein VJM07_07910 [Gaiella sp.]|nr:hypothetical protein [Gaiella sp.]